MPLGAFSLSQKIAVVTGAGSGINLSFAILAVQQGAKVLIADLRLTTEAEKFVKSEAEKGDAKSVVFVKCDVTKRADLENLVTESEKVWGDVPDVYIAGAGVFEPEWSNFWSDTEEDDYAQVSINITHPIKLSRIAIRSLLKKNKKGVVLVTSSLAGFQGTFSAPLYCATKHAVVGFVRSMEMLDGEAGIKVVAVAPGLVRTPLWTDRPDKMVQFGYTQENSITPEDVAESMIELCTNGNYGGGTCLEISKGGTRVLGTWNIEPPSSVGTSVDTISKEVLENNIRPIREILEGERGKAG